MKKADRVRHSVAWSPAAERDLIEAWHFIASESLGSIADRALKDIHHVAHLLGGFPGFGRARDDVRPGLHSVLAQRHAIFYRVRPKTVEIVRLLDERRDVDGMFWGE